MQQDADPTLVIPKHGSGSGCRTSQHGSQRLGSVTWCVMLAHLECATQESPLCNCFCYVYCRRLGSGAPIPSMQKGPCTHEKNMHMVLNNEFHRIAGCSSVQAVVEQSPACRMDVIERPGTAGRLTSGMHASFCLPSHFCPPPPPPPKFTHEKLRIWCRPIDVLEFIHLSFQRCLPQLLFHCTAGCSGFWAMVHQSAACGMGMPGVAGLHRPASAHQNHAHGVCAFRDRSPEVRGAWLIHSWTWCD